MYGNLAICDITQEMNCKFYLIPNQNKMDETTQGYNLPTVASWIFNALLCFEYPTSFPNLTVTFCSSQNSNGKLNVFKIISPELSSMLEVLIELPLKNKSTFVGISHLVLLI